jgi:CubicO group peptidase (beta-lactamase class C family)
MKRLILPAILISNLMISCKSGQESTNSVAIQKLDSLFSSQYPADEPGATILILRGDSVIFEKGYGIADMETKEPAGGETFYNIASVSKQFSGVALMMLEQEGKLSLDDNVKKWFPHFKAPFYEKITLRHLLSHTSGIPDSRDRTDRIFVTTATDTLSYSYLENLEELNFEPGASYEYMNPTFQLMYTIIEKASGMQFDEFMRKRIFDPAGMKEAIYFEEGRDIPRMAHGYLENKDSSGFMQFDYGEESFFATKADGGLYTSVREFVKWEQALRNNILITEETLRRAQTPKTSIADMPGHSYGYGWFIEQRDGFPDKIYHTGDNGGFQIYAARYPKEEILILIFSNRNDRNREENAQKTDEILKEAGWFQE